MIDLAKLQSFLLVARYLNFSTAAKHLHLTQPTISHHIKMLEQKFAVELFDRSSSDLKLTEAGHLLLPWAQRMVSESVEMQQMMASLSQKVVGHVRVACSTTAGKYILPLFAARFHQRYPGVQVTILRCAPAHVATRLLDSEANLGVLSFDARGEGLECQEFFMDHIILIAAKDHPWAERQYIEPSELLDVPLILREPTSGTRQVMLNELGKYDIALENLDVFLEVGSAEAIVKTVEEGFGVSFVSRLAATWALKQGSIVEIPVTKFALLRTIYMVRQRPLAANRATEAFWGFIHDASNVDLLNLAK